MLVSPSKPHEPPTTAQRRRRQYVLFVRLSVALMASIWVWKASLRYGLGSTSDQPYESESLQKQEVIRSSFGWGGSGMVLEDADMNNDAVAMTEKLRAILLGGSSQRGLDAVEAQAAYVEAEAEEKEQREAEEKEVAAQSDVEKKCRELIETHQVIPGRSWGTMQRLQKDEWVSLTCDRYFCQPHKMAGKGSYDCVPLAVSRERRSLRRQDGAVA